MNIAKNMETIFVAAAVVAVGIANAFAAQYLASQIDAKKAITASANEWAKSQVDAAGGKPTVVALHHPPFACGIGHMDKLRLDPAAASRLAALIACYPNVERVICGHVHRPMFVRFGGTIASAIRRPPIRWRSICATMRRQPS